MDVMFETARRALEKGMEQGLHSGAQLAVSLAGDRLPVCCVGEASEGVAMAEDVLLPWFSCTKLLTAIAVMQRWERGALDLDDPIGLHVPEFSPAGKEAITIRHALTHTGGFRGKADRIPSGQPVDWQRMVADVCAAPLEPGWIPGQRAAYHPRSGFVMLGEIVQRVTGRSFADVVTEEIIEPMGMVDGWVALSPERHLAYDGRMGAMYDTTDPAAPVWRDDLSRPTAFEQSDAASGAIGPARDLMCVPELILGRGELGGVRVLQPETVDAMVARHREGLTDETFGTVIDWGLGVMVNSWTYAQRPAPYGYGDHASAGTVGHGGVQSSVTFADREADLAVALICNGMPGEDANHRRTQPVLTALYEDLGLDPK